jgi:ubiquinol-cytochrome c reductase cytochrome b subunit
LGGVIALASSIIILFFIPLNNSNKFQGFQFYPISQFYFWLFVTSVILLTWIGIRPVETPYVIIGQILTLIYFILYLIIPLLNYKW